jgi:DNA-binding NtrC family response regulator
MGEHQQTNRLLIVDDDSALLEGLRECVKLRLPECEIQTCLSAQEGLQHLRKEDFDLILSDIRMPGMDGITFMQEVKKLFPHIPVVLMTAHGNETVKDAAKRHGAAQYIEKPFRREELILSIVTLLHRPK